MIKTYTITNEIGDSVNIINLGARITQWFTSVNNQSRNIIVGYDDNEIYRDDTSCCGAIAGPYANRIKGAVVTINGQKVKLNANEGNNILHGGSNALDTCMWQLKEQSDRAITLKYWVEDGFNGFPGSIVFEVEYRLAAKDSQLKINFNVFSEKETIIGPTGHAYFNLSANQSNINQHFLQVNCQSNTPVDDECIPTGNISSVSETPYDFTQLKAIGTTYINTNYVVDANSAYSAKLISPEQDLTLEVTSGYPGIQVYTGDYLHSPLNVRQGLCLEPQFFPNAPNVEHFEFYTTSADKPFSEKIVYKLTK